MNFLPGTPIDGSVYKQIKLRQDIFKALEGTDREQYIALQQSVPWVRLSSAVNIAPGTDLAETYGEGNTLAKNNILFNFLGQGEDKLPGYEYSPDGLGHRPKPGIIDVQIHSHNRFGSLRTAVVRFQCWTKEQIDKLELLYMRPGYTLLLEWGWSGYVDNETRRYVTDIRPLDLYSYSSGEKLRRALENKISSSDYNYDGIFGLIKNFSWSARPDGGYDCTTSIVTTGELVESYKANFYLSEVKVYEKLQAGVETYEETREAKKNIYTGKLPPEFTGLELRYYSQANDQVFTAGAAELLDFKNQAKVKAQEIQSYIGDIILQSGNNTITATDYEVVSEDTVVAKLTDLQRAENNQLVEIKPKVSLVKIRTNPVEFALKVNATNITAAKEKVEALLAISNNTLQLLPDFTPGTVAHSSYSTYDGTPAGVYTPRNTVGIKDVQVYRFFVLTYNPQETSQETEQGTIETAALSNPSAKSPEGNSGYNSMLHDLLVNDLSGRILAKYGEEFRRFNTQSTLKEVFKYRENTIIPGTLLQRLVTNTPRYSKVLSGVTSTPKPGTEPEEQSNSLVYIRLGMLLEAINQSLLQTSAGEKLFSFQTKPTSENKTPTYFVHEDQFSINPEICLLPSTLASYGIEVTPIVPVTNTGGIPCAILDIELECSYLVKTLDGFIGDVGRVAIYDFLNQIFSDVKRSTGGVMELDLQFSETTATYAIVDRRKISRPGRPFPVISLLGKDSTITNINLVSKLTPKISSMIAISAQESPFSGTEEAAGFEALNKGLRDGIYREKEDPLTSTLDKLAEYQEFLANFRNEAVTTKMYLDSFYVNRQILEGADFATGNYENYCKVILGKKFQFEGTAYSFIIPFELTLSIRGIGGLHVMESFKIDKRILPTTYGGRVTKKQGKNPTDVAFMITGLEHQINKQGWSVNVRTQIYNVDEDINEKPIVLQNSLILSSAAKSKGVTPTNTPWSSAFISYVHKTAGYTASTFPFSQSHTGYSQSIRKNFTTHFDVLDPSTTAPQPGDIVVANRAGNKMQFSTDPWSGFSHGDIVTEISYPANSTRMDVKGRFTAIGGNVGNSVKQSTGDVTLSRTPDGRGGFVFKYVLSTTSGRAGDGDYFVIIRPKSKTLTQQVIEVAKREYNFWNSNKYVETSPEAFNTLARYWKVVGVTLKAD